MYYMPLNVLCSCDVALLPTSILHSASFYPPLVTKDQPAGSPNLQIWTTEKVAEFIQKKQQDW